MKERITFMLAAVLTVFLASSTAFAQRPDGISYLVDVKTSFGTEFVDCLIFGDFGDLTVLGLGIPMSFDQGNLGNHEVFWQAVTQSGFGFSLAFSGMATGNSEDGMLKGDGISDFGDTFVLKGRPFDCGGLAPESLSGPSASGWIR